MDISKIKKGSTYKNYKEMCKLLGEKYKTGVAKQNQFKDWQRYFRWRNDGHKFIIDTIYKEPKLKISTYRHREIIKALILDLLIHSDDKIYYISKNKLIKQLELVNHNYFYAEKRQKRLSAYTKIPIEDIHDFYNSSNELFKRNINKALDELVDEAIIEYDTATFVCECKQFVNNPEQIKSKEEIVCDEFGDSKTIEIIDGDILKEYRQATPDEQSYIIKIKNDLLDEYKQLIKSQKGIDCEKKVSQIIRFGFGEPFFSEFNKILRDKLNISNVYKVYKISFNDEIVERQWEKECEALGTNNKERQIIDMNNRIKNNINKNARNRHNSAYILPSSNFVSHNSINKRINRTRDEYINNEFTLTNLLIDRDAKLIFQEMSKLHS